MLEVSETFDPIVPHYDCDGQGEKRACLPDWRRFMLVGHARLAQELGTPTRRSPQSKADLRCGPSSRTDENEQDQQLTADAIKVHAAQHEPVRHRRTATVTTKNTPRPTTDTMVFFVAVRIDGEWESSISVYALVLNEPVRGRRI